MQGHTSWVNTVSFSPDGKQLLTGGYDPTARLWASDTGENRFVLGGHRGGIYCAVFSRMGKRLQRAMKRWAGFGMHHRENSFAN